MTASLPSSYSAAFRAQLRRAFTPPYEAPLVVAVNGLLMTGAWYLLPLPLQDSLFRLHGPLAFPVVLMSWMLADVPATNVLGSDAERVYAALDDPAALRRLLYAKNAVLWLLAVPVCVVVAVVTGFAEQHWVATTITVAAILLVPVGGLGIAAWLGICFPYHPIPVAERWEHRRPLRRMIVRWLTLVTLPYVLVPWITAAIAAPAYVLWISISDDWHKRIPDTDLAIGVALTAAISATAFFVGHRVGLRLVDRRRAKLAAFLPQPDLG